MLHRIARTSFRHRRLVLALWSLALALAVTVGPALAGDYANSGRLPNTDSQAAYDTLARDFPQRHGDEAQIVFADITKNRPAIDAYLAKVAHAEGRDRGRADPVVSPGGTIAIAPITTANGDGDHPKQTAERHQGPRAAAAPRTASTCEFSGDWFGDDVDARQRARRHPRRDHRAAHRVRLADRDGPADPDRAHRHRDLARRRRDHRATSSRRRASRRRSRR